MTKRVRDAVKEEVKLELTPMIDVTFLILIFFMCTLKFKTLEGKLRSYLPSDRGLSPKTEALPPEEAEIILKIPRAEWDKDPLDRRVVFRRAGSRQAFGESLGVAFGSDSRVSGLKLSPPDTFERIRDYLAEIKRVDPDAKAKIRVSPRTPEVYVVQVLGLMLEEEYVDVSYSGIPVTLVRDLKAGRVR